MTKEEFRDWYKYFRGAFPSIAAWLAKFPKDQSSNSDLPTQTEVLGGWFKTLEKTELTDAKYATDQLSSGDEEMDFGFERTAAKVRSFANRARRERKFLEPKPNDGREPRYHCWRCQDTGFVPIVCPKDIKTIEETWPDGPPSKFDHQPRCSEAVRPLHLGRYSAACSCSKGQPMQGIIRFDSEECCYFPNTTEQSYQDVRDWFAARAVRIAESRKFAEWST